MQQVECHEHYGRIGARDRVLQTLETGDASTIEHDGFAVEQRGTTRQLARGLRDSGEAVRPIVAAPRDELDVPLVDAAQESIAVELRLVHPVLAQRGLAHERRELRSDGAR